MRRPNFLLAMACLALGCSILAPRPPAARLYSLGSASATYASWAGEAANICDSEEHWLFEELSSTNQLLDGVLAHSSARGGTWADRELPLLEEAVRTLPPVLDALEWSLAALARCPLARRGLFPELLPRARTLVAEARAQLAEGSHILAFDKTSRRWESWDRERAQEQGQAKARCGAPSAPTIYFAYRDELGQVAWLFCDGAQVLSQHGGPYQFQPPPGLSPAQLGQLHPPEYFLAARIYSPIREGPR